MPTHQQDLPFFRLLRSLQTLNATYCATLFSEIALNPGAAKVLRDVQVVVGDAGRHHLPRGDIHKLR